jgi:dUTP pyrophosphatase
MVVKFKLAQGARMPAYQSDGAAGMDLHASVPGGGVTIWPGRRVMVETGVSVEIPPGHEGQVRSRSGLAMKHGVVVLQGTGTIDADFRGPLSILLANHGGQPFEIRDGDRIAQLVVSPCVRAEAVQVEELAPSVRGADGWGSSGQR